VAELPNNKAIALSTDSLDGIGEERILKNGVRDAVFGGSKPAFFTNSRSEVISSDEYTVDENQQLSITTNTRLFVNSLNSDNISIISAIQLGGLTATLSELILDEMAKEIKEDMV